MIAKTNIFSYYLIVFVFAMGSYYIQNIPQIATLQIFGSGKGSLLAMSAGEARIKFSQKIKRLEKLEVSGRLLKNFNLLAMKFDYTKTTTKDFDSAVKNVKEEIGKAGMRVLHIHDVQKTLAEKGFEREPFKIVEFCSAKYANEFLKADIKIGLCMPCKINVYVKDGQTFIAGMRPAILPQFFPEADLGNRAQEIDQIIQNIINNAK